MSNNKHTDHIKKERDDKYSNNSAISSIINDDKNVLHYLNFENNYILYALIIIFMGGLVLSYGNIGMPLKSFSSYITSNVKQQNDYNNQKIDNYNIKISNFNENIQLEQKKLNEYKTRVEKEIVNNKILINSKEIDKQTNLIRDKIYLFNNQTQNQENLKYQNKKLNSYFTNISKEYNINIEHIKNIDQYYNKQRGVDNDISHNKDKINSIKDVLNSKQQEKDKLQNEINNILLKIDKDKNILDNNLYNISKNNKLIDEYKTRIDSINNDIKTYLKIYSKDKHDLSLLQDKQYKTIDRLDIVNNKYIEYINKNCNDIIDYRVNDINISIKMKENMLNNKNINKDEIIEIINGYRKEKDKYNEIKNTKECTQYKIKILNDMIVEIKEYNNNANNIRNQLTELHNKFKQIDQNMYNIDDSNNIQNLKSKYIKQNDENREYEESKSKLGENISKNVEIKSKLDSQLKVLNIDQLYNDKNAYNDLIYKLKNKKKSIDDMLQSLQNEGKYSFNNYKLYSITFDEIYKSYNKTFDERKFIVDSINNINEKIKKIEQFVK